MKPKSPKERVKIHGCSPYVYRIEIDCKRLNADRVDEETQEQLVVALQSMREDTVRECCSELMKYLLEVGGTEKVCPMDIHNALFSRLKVKP